ncbi:putative chemotaxis response regulator [[Clostridium] sordellii]|uniref:hypothetical protein n=1 Tax=Paraclostridium sordellii TaxID=1505 RepID=UPI0005E5BDF1|nr:hypothetical protein [Paeniclostridium sordellii]MDU1454516.1 hypothetical protein [Paeniclostridium sordellii]CEO11246.1 putative chemotaxis response regulator [[Clostridium] sordellii] [Paeniclostridium sordellii]
MNNQYNLHKYVNGNNIIDRIISILNEDDINTDMEIEIINSIADFIQNNLQYDYLDSFNKLADIVVNIIENFNDKSIDLYVDKKNRICNLIKSLSNLKEDFNGIEVNLYFYGKDKYNIIDRCTNKNVIYINDINEYIHLNNEIKNDQIKILIVSEETVDSNLDFNLYFNDVLYYDKLMNAMFEISEKIYYENYDYNYLLKSLEKCKCENIETLVVGNSYPLTGIDSKLLSNKSENLSISSQDLYYSYKLAKEVINNNENIKRCIIGAGYYLVNHDLSKCKSEYSINMVRCLYYPILKDKHNSEKVDTIEISNLINTLNNNVIEYIFNLDFLHKHFIDLIHRESNGYFNKNLRREMISILQGVKLSSISEAEKYRLGEIRASQHNDLSKYTETKKEYNLIFNDFINFLKEKGVEPVIVVFPTTKYYSKFINETYKEEFYKIIDGIKEKYEVKLVDFSKMDIFEEDDFIDFDHMSETGCIKITHELNKILN